MNTYRVYFTYGGKEKSYDFKCSTPITALNQFHRLLQTTRETDSERRLLRPMLKPEEYKITRICHRYHDCSFQKDVSRTPIVESGFDLPGGPNPVVVEPKYSLTSHPELAL